MAKYQIAQLDEIPGVPCPCGTARRAFAEFGEGLATVHMTTISAEARTHYHKKMTEIYVILDGEGFMELDGERIPVRPRSSIFIKPGCRHRAVGDLQCLIVPIPAFDPADEWFD